MNRRQRKKLLLASLTSKDFQQVRDALSQIDALETINALFSGLCAISETVRWNTVRAFGVVVPEIANTKLEKARVIMRRFLWSLNDESGGIGWGAPEAMAEIMVHHERLFAEYHHMLISYMREDGPELHADGNYLELPMLQRGLLWGIGRLCEIKPEVMIKAGVPEDLIQYLDSEDTVVSGLAVRALNYCGDFSQKTKVEKLLTAKTQITFLDQERCVTTTVQELATNYLNTMQGA